MHDDDLESQLEQLDFDPDATTFVDPVLVGLAVAGCILAEGRDIHGRATQTHRLAEKLGRAVRLRGRRSAAGGQPLDETYDPSEHGIAVVFVGDEPIVELPTHRLV